MSKDGYVLQEPEGPRDITMITAGTDVAIARAMAMRMGLAPGSEDMRTATIESVCN